MSVVFIEHLQKQNGEKMLYLDSTLRVNEGEHVALLGPNGAGKTTLLNMIVGKETPDKGTIEIHPKAKVGYLDQHQDVDMEETVDEYFKEAFKDLYEINDQIQKIYADMAVEYKEEDLVKALDLQEQLNLKGFDTIDKQIGELVNGLGIDPNNLPKKLGELSGGQRGKVLLAGLLLKHDDFLLLDEPTNFLDVEQVEWLANFLANYPSAFLLVSHDNDFINKTVNIIYAIENQHIERYVGNYDKYLELSALRKEQYDKAFEAQQEKLKKLQTYVDKNKARASTAKSAQSRQKQIDKMDKMTKRTELAKPSFQFKYKRPASSVVVLAENLEIGYKFPLLEKPLTFELREGEKALVRGYNGIGKTTFLNTLAGILKPISGTVKLGDGVKVAYFKQLENDNDITPIAYLMNQDRDLTESEARACLGRVGIKSELMLNTMGTLSGGEQTKVRIAALTLEPASLLILDEPTNHIDVLAKEALLEAIEAFDGTVLLTTHDTNFETNWADKVLNFEDLVN